MQVGITNEPLTLENGSKFVAQYNCTWTGNITNAGGAFIEGFDSGIFDLRCRITGTGDVTSYRTSTSYGTNRFSGAVANDYVGTTYVTRGLLGLAKSGSVTAIPGALTLSGTSTVRMLADTMINDSSDITLGASSVLDMNGYSDYVDALSGSGSVTLGAVNNYFVIGDSGGSSTFDGIISGAGRFYKFGAGTITLNGNNTLTGMTAVENGTLLVNGSQPQSPAYVYDPGILGGTGIVGNLNCEANVNPGVSPGILTCSNLTFISTGDYYVDLAGISPGTGYDQLNVRGTNQLASATLHVVPAFASPVAVGEHVHHHQQRRRRNLSGTFNGLADGATIDTGFSSGSITPTTWP